MLEPFLLHRGFRLTIFRFLPHLGVQNGGSASDWKDRPVRQAFLERSASTPGMV
jgi:hypothetical protein